MKRVGFVTIGQSPRRDIVPEIMESLGHGYVAVERGALDDLSLEEVRSREPKTCEGLLVTRMRDGTEVRVSKSLVVPRMQRCIEELEAMGLEVILLLCAGGFPEFKSKALVVRPLEVLRGVVDASLRKGRLGVLYPAAEQTAKAVEEWGTDEREVYADAASPYGSIEEVERAAHRLAEENVDLTLMVCMGYTREMKRIVRDTTGRPVILASSMTARALKELLS
jgi:protein AroM